MPSFGVKFDLSALTAKYDAIDARVKRSIRPAAQAGAQVFYDEVNVNVSKIGKKTGNLANSIYQVYSKDQSSPSRATYHISWNASKAPHGHLVEFGHIQTRKAYIGSDGNWYTSKVLLSEPKQVAAQPFVRLAISKAGAALKAAEEKFFEQMKAAQ